MLGYQSHVSNPRQHDPFSSGWEEQICLCTSFQYRWAKKRLEHPKLPWPMLSHVHASMLLVIYIHCFDLFCWCDEHCTTADERLQNMLRLPVCSQDSYCRCFLANYLPLKERTLTMELDNDRLRNAGKSWALSCLPSLGINISHLGKRKIIFKMQFLGDMLVPWRVTFLGICHSSHPNTVHVFPRRCFKQVSKQAHAAEATRWWDWMSLWLKTQTRLFGVNVIGTNKLRSREWIPQRKYVITLWP